MSGTKFQKPSTNAQQANVSKENTSVEKTSLPKEAQTTQSGTKIPVTELMKNVIGTAGDIGKMGSGINTKLANAIVSSGAKDELMTDDVYGKKNSDVINKLSGLLKGGDLSSLGLGNGKTSIVGDLMKMVKTDGGKLSLDTKGWTDRLVAEMGTGSGSFAGLTDGLKGSLTSSLSITPATYDKILLSVGDAYSAYKSGDLTSAKGVFNLMGKICGDSQFFQAVDLGAQSNLFTSLVDQAIRLGVPDAIDKLIEKSRDRSVTDTALLNNIDTALRAGDVRTVNLIASTMGDGRVRAQVPQAARVLLANWRIPAKKKENDYPALWAELKATLDRIHPGWETVDRNGVAVTDLTVFSLASEDVRKVASTDAAMRVMSTIAGAYESRNLMETALQQYPLLAA